MFCLSGTWAGGDKPTHLPVASKVKYNFKEHGDTSVVGHFKSCFFILLGSSIEELSVGGMEKRAEGDKPNVVY